MSLKTLPFLPLSGLQSALLSSFVLLGGFYIGGQVALVGAAFVFPLILGLVSVWHGRTDVPKAGIDVVISAAWDEAQDTRLNAAIFEIAVDNLKDIAAQHGSDAATVVQERLGERLRTTLRAGDAFEAGESEVFTAVLGARAGIDLEACIQLSARLQTAAEEPILADGVTIWATVSIGFCLRSRAPGTEPETWRDAATSALTEARRHGPGTIRAFSRNMAAARATTAVLEEDIGTALETGHVQPWFQPQISTETGRVSGFEALARWLHPDKGVLLPETFLEPVATQGLSGRMGEVILYHTLTALKAWDAAGVEVPTVAINLSDAELANPHIVDKIAWELDRFDLTPERLALEVTERTVASEPTDMVCRNLVALGRLGCRIDLDDFGTGSASIAAIRRFKVGRIKVHESFVNRADRDPEQQRLVGAVLSMAERLGVQTLAEGVETVGEHALLAQLGCDDVQGYGIGRPMPFDQTLTWMRTHEAKLQDAPRIGPSGNDGGSVRRSG
ncbi:MAG: GGDEF domain-containing phosphodiesterase [Pseudomonadota bacterium]